MLPISEQYFKNNCPKMCFLYNQIIAIKYLTEINKGIDFI